MNNKEYKLRLKKVNPLVFPLEPYKDILTPIKHKCLVCGYGSRGEWTPIPNNLLNNGNGCPKCGHKRTNKGKYKGALYYKNKVKRIVGNEYTIHTADINTKHKITMTHNNCIEGGHYTYSVYIQKFLAGRRCPRCAKILRSNNRKYNNDSVDRIINNILGPEYHRVSKYVDSYHKMKIFHDKCQMPIMLSLRQIVDSHTGCYICSNISKGESFISEYLIQHSIAYEYQKSFKGCYDKNTLPFDFYLSQFNLAIEYDGIQHFNKDSFYYSTVQIKHDHIKTSFCKKHGIKLLRIPYEVNTYKEIGILISAILNNSDVPKGIRYSLI